MNLIERNAGGIRRLCEKHRVATLFVFGSAFTEHFSDESDVDLLVDFNDINLNEYADNYFSFKFSLEDLLLRHVDLLEQRAIKNPFVRQAIETNKKLIYGY
jgi:predicted nucleotidyltransferase